MTITAELSNSQHPEHGHLTVNFPIPRDEYDRVLDKLDYLAKRLDSFTAQELAQFQGMAVKLGTFDMRDFINLTLYSWPMP